MPRRRVPQPAVAAEPLVVHPDWQLRVAGIAAAAVCDVRPATLADRRLAGAVLTPLGRPEERGPDDDTLLLVAWADPAILATGPGLPPRPPDRTAGSQVRPVGCLGIRWSGPLDPEVRAAAGSSVELFGLVVARGVRRLGIGHALLGAAEHRCLQAGSPRLVARIAAEAVDTLGRRARSAGFGSLFADESMAPPAPGAGAEPVPCGPPLTRSPSPAGTGTWLLKDLPDPVRAAALRPPTLTPADLSRLLALLTAHCSLLTAHCSLLTAHCSLLKDLPDPVQAAHSARRRAPRPTGAGSWHPHCPKTHGPRPTAAPRTAPIAAAAAGGVGRPIAGSQ